MTAHGFRKIALSLPEVTEASHMDHPDFRVSGKIFATLGYPDKSWGMVRLSPTRQAAFVAAEPEAFVPVKGAWGRRGATNVNLRAVRSESVRAALEAAWAGIAPARIAAIHEKIPMTLREGVGQAPEPSKPLRRHRRAGK